MKMYEFNRTEIETVVKNTLELGKKQERGRILEILEAEIKEAEAEGNYLSGVFLNKWLPLIKGENNDF